jgi:phosphatidylglycerophosphatase A
MPPGTDVFTLMTYIFTLIERVQWLFWAAAIALFFLGLARFIKNAADTQAHEEGKKYMLWGIVALFILVTLWGIVNFLLFGSLGINPTYSPTFRDKNGVTVP